MAVAYAFHLVDEEQHRNLHIIRDVRNYCAHSFTEAAFDIADIESHTRELTFDPNRIEFYRQEFGVEVSDDEEDDEDGSGVPSVSETRFAYMVTVADLLKHLMDQEND